MIQAIVIIETKKVGRKSASQAIIAISSSLPILWGRCIQKNPLVWKALIIYVSFVFLNMF